MRFETTSLGATFRAQLAAASKATIAVAFFNPDSETLTALRKVGTLNLVVSDDFQVNNPYKLESLRAAGVLRNILSDAGSGKLHSKVFLIHRTDGTRWAMIGSANLTWPGLFSNQEACVIFDSRDHFDSVHLDSIERWIETLLDAASDINFGTAKRIFDARAKYRLVQYDPQAMGRKAYIQTSHYWALKTTAGADGDQHWQDFRLKMSLPSGGRALMEILPL